jgi:DNA-3-methyladenine glycosylase
MKTAAKITMDFFAHSADAVAKALIGALILYKSPDRCVGGYIVETEAYDENDPASHTEYKKRNMNRPMYRPHGYLYIYPNSKYCSLNFVCDREDFGSAVLIRALEPLEESKPIMRIVRCAQRRAAATNDRLLCNGPINLCQSLGVGPDNNDRKLDDSPFELYAPAEKIDVWCGPRVGVNDIKPRRYVYPGSAYISHHNEKRYPLSADRCQ